MKTLFSTITTTIGQLLDKVNSGELALPDLQRPFVWKDTKVRDLLDSMLKGYPIGYIMTWHSPDEYEKVKNIGVNDKDYSTPASLVVDGQQRLTALLSALYGIKVKDANYQQRAIRISFNPLTKEFAVWTPAYERNPEWISSISELFEADYSHEIPRYRKNYFKRCNEAREKNEKPKLTDDEEEKIETNINSVLDLLKYQLTELAINSTADEEDVAEIFVRTNSGGQKLTENNFIETLLAVYDRDVHSKINSFCEEARLPQDGTSYNVILEPTPSHLIRMAVGLGFRRARLRYAYMLLRGKDLETGVITSAEREENLAKFKQALDRVINLNNWHAIMHLFEKAGYVTGTFVSSTNAVVFSYVLYLMGKYDYKVPPVKLQKIIAKWIYMSTITYFYTGSTESQVEKQFADLRNVKTADEFITYLDGVIRSNFSDDYFDITLPVELESASANSTAWNGYVAALNVLGAHMLFSTTLLQSYLVPGATGNKKAVDRHHIFPKAYLSKIGFTSDRDRNQIANFTYLDYNSNINIADRPPEEYVSYYRQQLGEEEYKKSCSENALPEGFEKMDYRDFLEKRRKLMAGIVKKAYEKLCK